MKKILSQYGGMKREIYILFFGKLVTAMGSFVWPMLTFLLTAKLGLSDGIATLLIASGGLISLPAALWGGKLADRFPRKYIIMGFDLMTVVLYTAAFFLPIGYFTAAVVFFAGLFQNVESPAYDALIADYSTVAQREKAFSLNYLGFNLGFVVGASLSGVLFEFHTNLAFLLNGIAVLISTVLIILFVRRKNVITDAGTEEECLGEYEKPVDETLSIFQVLKLRKVVAAVMLVGCFAAMTNNTVGILLPLQLKEQMGAAGAATYGYLNSLNGFVVILFTPLLTMAFARLTEVPKAILGMLLFMGGMFLFSLESAVWVLYLGMFIYSIGEVVTVLGTNPYTSRRIPASHRGRIGGITSVLFAVFFSLTQYGISFVLLLSQGNYPLLWALFLGAGTCAVVLYLITYPIDRKSFPALYQESIL